MSLSFLAAGIIGFFLLAWIAQRWSILAAGAAVLLLAALLH